MKTKKIISLILSCMLVLINFNYVFADEKVIANISAFNKIEAENYSEQSGTSVEDCSDIGGGKDVGSIDTGDYLMYKNIDFGNGAEGFQIRAASPSDYAYVDIKLDSLSGTSVGTCLVSPTGDWQAWKDAPCKINKVTGVHNVYLVFKDFGGVNVNYFSFLKDAPMVNPDQNEQLGDGYTPLDKSITQRDNGIDECLAIDALGRQLVTNKEAGAPRKNKYVGMFYFISQQKQTGEIYDNTKILNQNPKNPQFGTDGAPHYWSQPYLGYYLSQDEYVIRKHAEMLSDAGVDTIILDISNGVLFEPTWAKVFKVFYDIRKEGGKTPQIMFHCGLESDKAKKLVPELYKELYSKGLYKELWFMWNGKPLILGDNSTLDDSLKNFFSFRKSWAWTGSGSWFGDGKDSWPWLDNYPQKFGWDSSKNKPEETSVCVAQHATTNIGRSFHDGAEPKDVTLDMTLKGLNFKEQWERALQIDPDFIFVTGWNEWTAGKCTANDGDQFIGKTLKKGDPYFIDEYNEEYSRDIEPENGLLKDNYYYQLVNYIRMFKGVRAVSKSSGNQSISINNDFSQWDNVKNVYKDTINDTTHRNTMSFANKINYVNNTGRNDFDEMKVTSDDKNVYFYAKTKDNITTPDNNNWMTLLINSDNNDKTGWEGYDFIVNHDIKNNTTGYLDKNSGGWNWSKSCEIPFIVKGNEIHFAIPKDKLGMKPGSPLTFKFKWVDNVPNSGDIMELIDKGDAAPNQRFSYVYTENDIQSVPERPSKEAYKEPVTLPGFQKYEAEYANLNGSISIDWNHNDFSGIGFVDNWNKNDELKFNVTSEDNSIKTLKISYANGMSEARNLSLYVNDQKIKQLSFPVVQAGNWDPWSMINEEIKLNKGQNTVSIKYDDGDNGSVNVDFIAIDNTTDANVPGSNKYEAELGAIAGGVSINTNHTGFSGTGFLDNWSNVNASVTFKVKSDSACKKNIKIAYANGMGDTRNLSLYVNDSKIKQLSFPVVKAGNWDSWSNITEEVQLKSGDNFITIKYDNGDNGSVNLDYIEVQDVPLILSPNEFTFESQKNSSVVVNGNISCVKMESQTIDENSIPQNTKIIKFEDSILNVDESDGIFKKDTENHKKVNKIIELKMIPMDINGTEVNGTIKFKKSLKVSINLSKDDFTNLDINNVYLYYFDEINNKWVKVGKADIDENYKVSFEVGHFTKFALFQENANDNNKPTNPTDNNNNNNNNRPTEPSVNNNNDNNNNKLLTPINNNGNNISSANNKTDNNKNNIQSNSTKKIIGSLLPKTGSEVDSLMLLYSGVLIIFSGIALVVLKSKK